MHLEVSFKNIRPRDEIRQRATALFKKLERFLDDAAEANLVVDVEHGNAILELVLRHNGETNKVTAEHNDLRTALDQLFHTAETQLRRAKERRADGRRQPKEDADGFVDEAEA